MGCWRGFFFLSVLSFFALVKLILVIFLKQFKKFLMMDIVLEDIGVESLLLSAFSVALSSQTLLLQN